MLRKVAFTMYPVKDMPRARAFYEETLGLPPSSNGAKSPWVEFDLPGGGCLAITTVTPNEPSASAGGTIAFEVDDLAGDGRGPEGEGRRIRRRGDRKPGLPHGDRQGPGRQCDHPAQVEARDVSAPADTSLPGRPVSFCAGERGEGRSGIEVGRLRIRRASTNCSSTTEEPAKLRGRMRFAGGAHGRCA